MRTNRAPSQKDLYIEREVDNTIRDLKEAERLDELFIDEKKIVALAEQFCTTNNIAVTADNAGIVDDVKKAFQIKIFQAYSADYLQDTKKLRPDNTPDQRRLATYQKQAEYFSKLNGSDIVYSKKINEIADATMKSDEKMTLARVRQEAQPAQTGETPLEEFSEFSPDRAPASKYLQNLETMLADVQAFKIQNFEGVKNSALTFLSGNRKEEKAAIHELFLRITSAINHYKDPTLAQLTRSTSDGFVKLNEGIQNACRLSPALKDKLLKSELITGSPSAGYQAAVKPEKPIMLDPSRLDRLDSPADPGGDSAPRTPGK